MPTHRPLAISLLIVSVGWLAACPDPTTIAPGGNAPAGGHPPGGPGAGPTVEGMGGPPPGGPGASGRPEGSHFNVTPGQGVELSGSFVYAGDATGGRRVDFLTMAEGAPPVLVHAITLDNPGEWKVEAPKDFGEVYVVAFIDRTGDGPSADDPRGRLENAVKVGTEPITGLTLTLTDNGNLGELMPGGNPHPPGDAGPTGTSGTVPGGAVPGAPGTLPPEGGSPAPLPEGSGAAVLPEGGSTGTPLSPGAAPLPSGK